MKATLGALGHPRSVRPEGEPNADIDGAWKLRPASMPPQLAWVRVAALAALRPHFEQRMGASRRPPPEDHRRDRGRCPHVSVA
jgi:hypothetical protein